MTRCKVRSELQSYHQQRTLYHFRFPSRDFTIDDHKIYGARSPVDPDDCIVHVCANGIYRYINTISTPTAPTSKLTSIPDPTSTSKRQAESGPASSPMTRTPEEHAEEIETLFEERRGCEMPAVVYEYTGVQDSVCTAAYAC